ncbi:hypothetical protein [Methylomagnum sp.]
MPTIIEGKLLFTFPDDWLVEKYDETAFYRDHFQKLASSKCVDVVAFSPRAESLWLIEAKDYRINGREKSMDLCAEVAHKVRDTLANLYLAQRHPELSIHEFATMAGQKPKIRVALHIEQPKVPSKVRPPVIDRNKGLLKFQQMLRVVDPHPWLCEIGAMPLDCPWQVTTLE